MPWLDLLWWHVTFSYCMCLTRYSAMLAATITNCEWVLLVGQFAGKHRWEFWFQSMCSLNCLGIHEMLHYREIWQSCGLCPYRQTPAQTLHSGHPWGVSLTAIAADGINELAAASQIPQSNIHSCDCLNFLLCSCLLSPSQCPTPAVWNGSCCLLVCPGPFPPTHHASPWCYQCFFTAARPDQDCFWDQVSKPNTAGSAWFGALLSASVLYLLVMWTQLHLQLLQLLAQTFHPVPSMSVWQPNLACHSLIQLPLIHLSRESGKLWQKILCYVEWEIDSAINKAIASK